MAQLQARASKRTTFERTTWSLASPNQAVTRTNLRFLKKRRRAPISGCSLSLSVRLVTGRAAPQGYVHHTHPFRENRVAHLSVAELAGVVDLLVSKTDGRSGNRFRLGIGFRVVWRRYFTRRLRCVVLIGQPVLRRAGKAKERRRPVEAIAPSRSRLSPPCGPVAGMKGEVRRIFAGPTCAFSGPYAHRNRKKASFSDFWGSKEFGVGVSQAQKGPRPCEPGAVPDA